MLANRMVLNAETAWIQLKEAYVQRLFFRYARSDYPGQCRAILDRFTQYQQLTFAPLQSITAQDIERYIQARQRDLWRGRPIGVRTLNNEIDVINACLAYAGPPGARKAERHRLGLLERPPFVDRLPECELEPRAATESQIRAFLQAAAGATCPQVPGLAPERFWCIALTLGLVTALRRRALLNVPRPTEFELRELRQLVVPAEFSKTRRIIRIPLTDSVIALIDELPTRPGEPLLPWRDRQGRPMTLDYFNERMKQLQTAAGIRDTVTLKQLRSLAATEAIEQFGPEVARRRLAHTASSEVLHQHYIAKRISAPEVAATDHLAGIVLGQLRVVRAVG